VKNNYAVTGHWSGAFDESGMLDWVQRLRGKLAADRVSLGLVFMTPRYFQWARQVLEICQVHARIPLLAGCSSSGLIHDAVELEEKGGIVLGLYHLPGAELVGCHFTQSEVEKAGEEPLNWPAFTEVQPRQNNGWLAFVDPFHMDSEAWLKSWSRAYDPAPVMGGLASGEAAEQLTQVYLNGEVYEEGGVAVSFGGDVQLKGVTCQGCTPIGETWTLTKVQQNIIQGIGNRPAYEVLAETFSRLSEEDQASARNGNLFIGLAMNEYVEDFHRGDFLVRNLLGADPRSGNIAVGAFPRPGQTIQFQQRSAAAATEDMRQLLSRARGELRETPIYGACLCSCNGRGRGLFGRPNHDPEMVQEHLGPLGLTGFFCNGEIGPVSAKNFLHGYTASVALFTKKGRD
jgi:small ligand-binding sensory domain FIST